MKSIKKILKIVISWGVVISFGFILFKNAGEYGTLINTVANANFVLAIWGIILAIGNIAVITAIFKTNYSIFTQKETNIGNILPEMIVFSFLMISNPLGVTGAAAYLSRRLEGKGFSMIHSLFTSFSMQLSTNIALLPILGSALFLLNQDHNLNTYQLFASIFLLSLCVIFIALMALLIITPQFSRRAAKRVAKITNSISNAIFHTCLVNVKKIDKRINEIQEISDTFDNSPKKLVTTFSLSVIYHCINIIILFLAFQTFNQAISFSNLVTLYGIMALFTIVTPNPQGIGIAEGTAQLLAISLGIPNESAIVSILGYRVMTLWFPALCGLFVYKFKKPEYLSTNQECVT